MHSDISSRSPLFPAASGMAPRSNPLTRLLSAAMRTWQRRKMIATFDAMDDWMLNDIGLRREDIVRTVYGFDEMRMTGRTPDRAMTRADIRTGRAA
ncbi:DUF1127 domain-containing protein [Roseovarius dicentrarchi]|uniref:DUF1127 domain-containing protein n=1 Tax=Roseovarius dicentrarchi TaxID=2250573 RepID=UPI001396731F|nr:DUF1127 domain-containing protein [Roseovarius dicentrarchi]